MSIRLLGSKPVANTHTCTDAVGKMQPDFLLLILGGKNCAAIIVCHLLLESFTFYATYRKNKGNGILHEIFVF